MPASCRTRAARGEAEGRGIRPLAEPDDRDDLRPVALRGDRA